jgi:predicted nucleic acid-binding protein
VPFVLDASVSAVWALSGESHPLAEKILDRWGNASGNRETALVPSVWWFELRNLLVVNERRKRLAPDESNAFLKVLGLLPIHTDGDRDEKAMFNYCRKYQLSFYDAAYLDVAVRNDLPLATLDKALQSAAQAAGISLLV